MSSLRERIDGLVAQWRGATKAISAEGHERPLEWEGKDILRLCADELAAALAAEGQGDDPCTNTLKDMEQFLMPEWEQAKEEVFADNNYGWAMVAKVAIRMRIMAVVPSLHKEGVSLQKVAAVNSSVSLAHSAFLSQQAAALHKEGAGGEPEVKYPDIDWDKGNLPGGTR